jgi:hypothetical protein
MKSVKVTLKNIPTNDYGVVSGFLSQCFTLMP